MSRLQPPAEPIHIPPDSPNSQSSSSYLSRSNSPSSMGLPRARYRSYPCRWDWCRFTFPTNALLIDHVLLEHVRNAQPVSRKDVLMLRRVEEGSGDTFSLSGFDPQSSYPLPSISSTSPRPSKRARIDPESPARLHSQSQANLQSHSQVTNSAYQSDIDQNSFQRQTQAQRSDPTPPTPPTSHAASTPGPSTPNKHQGSTHEPENSQEQESSSPPRRASFHQLSSPDGTPHPSRSIPASPSFDSQVNDAVKGRKFRTLGFESPSPAQSQEGDVYAYTDSSTHGIGGQGSQEIVESQLTEGLEYDEELDLDRRQNQVQDMDMYGDADAEGEPEPVSPNELQYPEGLDSWNQNHGSQSLNPMPVVLHTQAQGHLSTIPESHDSAQSPLNPQDPLPSSPGYSAPYLKQTRTPAPSSPGTHLTDQTPNQTPTQSRRLRPRNSFRSGSLRISPMPPKSRPTPTRRSRTPVEPPTKPPSRPPSRQQPHRKTRATSVVTEPDANGDVDMDTVASDFLSQAVSQSHTSQSQDSSQSYPTPYYQLQTQAPYQSQFSQSLSETSAG